MAPYRAAASRIRWPRGLARAAGLDEAAATLLEETGVPDVDWIFALRPPPDGWPAPRDGLVTIGDHGGVVPIALDLASGRVVAIESARVERPMSSSLRAFVGLLDLYAEAIDAIAGSENDAGELAAVDAWERNMRALDPQVMSDGDSYWSVLLVETRDGRA